MKFQIYRTLNYQPNYEKILEDYPVLANYNLKKDDAGNCYVIITSIKQLKQLVKEINQEIILSPVNDGIEIYDEYRE
jgi:hypothetical protein